MTCLFIILVLAATASVGQGAVIWVQDLRNTEIPESASPGDRVGTLEARDDQNTGRTFEYRIVDLTVSPDAYDYLQVELSTGVVTVKAEMDYEIFTEMTAQWTAGTVISSEVTIYIKNENDNPPVFQGEPYSAEVSENTNISQSVTKVTATDDDGDTILYELVTGSDCEMDHFRIDPNSGDILVNQTLDYASVVQYTVCVNATDGDFSVTTDVVISIRDAQNQPPVFIGQPYDKTIPEDTPVGEVVLTVVANDGDLGVSPRNDIIYKLIDDANGTFSVHESNGDIKVEKELDRETEPITQLYTLLVQAREDDTQPLAQITTNTSIYIRLEDVDDNIPTFNKEGPVIATIPESSPRGTQLDFRLEVFDLDSGDKGQIILTLEDDDGIFYLQSDEIFNSGVVDIRVEDSSALDFERISNVSFMINASTASGMNSSLITAIVNLTNINDNSPVFSEVQYDVLLPENSVEGTFIIQIEAADADMGTELSYSLLGYSNDWFTVDSSTGNITVSADANFDAELLSVYFLTCLASDGDRVNTALLNVTVTDVNDNTPAFLSDLYTVSIPEYNLNDSDPSEEREISIPQLLATDADVAITNRMLTYSIESGNEDGKFTINSTSGIISRNESIDLETEKESYELVVIATDSGTPSLNGNATVIINIEDINDNDPVFMNDSYTGEVAENAQFGTFVTNVTAVDADINSLPVLYTIIDNASPFIVDSLYGYIRLSGTVDYEIQMIYNLTVIATDREDISRQDSCQVSIQILDVNDESPVFETPFPSSIPVNENATYCERLNGSDPGDCEVLITLNASDPDTNASLSYYITEVKGYDQNSRLVDANFSSQFGVDSETDQVFVRMKLDRETVPRFDVTVRVYDVNAEEDPDDQFDSAELMITVEDVNDNAPNFTGLPDSFTTPETDQIGMVISVNIRAVDDDAGDNGLVTYELLDDAGGLVRIDENTGILSVNQSIDKEQYDSLSIIICAKDLGDPPLSSTVTRQIFITDVNDNTPEFDTTLPTEASILENSPNGTFVLSVYATDADSDYGNIIYSITAGVGFEDFEIDPENGDITVKKKPDREEQSLYTLTVEASDGQRQDTLEVTITILDENDNAPKFTDSFPDRTTISETAEPGSSVASIVAVDIDDPETNNSVVRYNMTNLNGTEFFLINDFTGVVTFSDGTDLAPGVYVLEVEAFDLGDPPLSTGPRDFLVIVTDYNDEAPVFVHPLQGSTVFVEESYTGYITTAEATDGDSGVNGIVTFKFNTGLGATDDYEHFSIDEVTGEISIKITSETDRETQEIYILGIIAMNADSVPPRESQVTFYVQVNDTDDNEPAYWGERTGPDGPMSPPDPAVLEVQENLGNGTFVGTVPAAIDLDSDLYNQIYYFIVSGTNENYFNLDKVSGNLTLLNPIDREIRPQFSLVIRADSDPTFEPNGNEIYDPLKDDNLARVTVVVSDVNDSPPRFEKDRYTAGVLYSTSFGVVVITMTAVDPDLGSNAVVNYEITSQTSYDADGNVKSEEVNVFAINSQGQVINTVTFQASDDTYYIVEVLATDSLRSNFTDNATLSVYLMEETDQVSVIFADEPNNVRATQDNFTRLLEEIMVEVGGYSEVSVNIDSVDYERYSDGEGIANRTEMLLHVVDDVTNTVIEPKTVQKAIDSASGYTEQLVSYHVLEVEYKIKQVEPDVLTAVQTFSFTLASIMFLVLILILVSYYFSVSSYRRQIRAYEAYTEKNDKEKETPAPGTNFYADQKNPIYNPKATEEKEPLSDEDEAGNEAKKTPPEPKEEEDQEAVIDFDAEHAYENTDANGGDGDGNKLLDQMLAGYEKQRGSINLAADTREEDRNELFSDV